MFYNWDLDNSWLKSVEANAYRQVSDRHFYSFVQTVWNERDINTIGELTTDGALLQLNLQTLGNHQLIAGLQYLNDEVDQDRRSSGTRLGMEPTSRRLHFFSHLVSGFHAVIIVRGSESPTGGHSPLDMRWS